LGGANKPLLLFIYGGFMKRESLITNTEKLLFDILETLKRIEGNTNPLPFVVSEEIGNERKESEIKSNAKTNVKKNVKPKKKG
jgi:hypothetical protein